MSWSWSHTFAAYCYAKGELQEFDRSTLLEILAEWRMHDRHPDNDAAWPDQWPKALAAVTRLNEDVCTQSLVERVWDRASTQKTCDNGGWNAWMCPYGCHCHCVDFGPEDSNMHPRVTREDAERMGVFV